MVFGGISEAALDFYDDLEIDNSKVFWEAHKDTLPRRGRRADDRVDRRIGR